MGLTTGQDVANYCLARADEAIDTTSTFQALMTNLLIEAWRMLTMEHPFLGLLATPPQAQVVPAAITTLTLTTTAGSTAATLSAAPTGVGGGNISIANWWILVGGVGPTGQTYYMRVSAHNSGAMALTLDAMAPEALAAKSVVLALMELTLSTGTGILANRLWTSGGGFDNAGTDFYTEEEMNRAYPGNPTQSWPPDMACRVGMTTLRLSHYDTTPHRVEIPYFQELSDPSATGTTPLGIPTHLIPAFAEKVLALLYEAKGDSRRELADARYQGWIDRAKKYDHMLRVSQGTGGQQRRNEPYGEGGWPGGSRS